MEVVSINSKRKEEIVQEEQKKAMLDVLDHMKKEVEEGTMKELVACSIDSFGECKIHASAMDSPGAIGLFEIGKHLLISNETD